MSSIAGFDGFAGEAAEGAIEDDGTTAGSAGGFSGGSLAGAGGNATTSIAGFDGFAGEAAEGAIEDDGTTAASAGGFGGGITAASSGDFGRGGLASAIGDTMTSVAGFGGEGIVALGGVVGIAAGRAGRSADPAGWRGVSGGAEGGTAARLACT
jgi:hypothetical protein